VFLPSLSPNQPIGIFDSGIGGLTVFSELQKLLPLEDFVYLGDTARVPYGTKSSEMVLHYSQHNVKFLLEKKVKMVVVACNTASAFALLELQKYYPIPIIGVIDPGAQGAMKTSQKNRIGVIGTEGTIRSDAYAKTILRKNPKTFVVSTPCPLFVPLVEEGWLEGEVTEQVASIYLKKIISEKVDTLILGCTHYPLLKRTLKKVVGNSIQLIDSAEETALETKHILEENKILRKENLQPTGQFFVTDSPERFRRVGELFLKTPIQKVNHVTIEM